MLPAYIRYDLRAGSYERIAPPETPPSIEDPAKYGDNWSDVLEKEDKAAIDRYFGAVELLRDSLDAVCFKVGGQEHRVNLSPRNVGRSITFEVPRGSLMTAVGYEIFDDLLIGNFMRTTLHGDWDGTHLYPHLVPALTKYADNGRAKTKAQVETYIAEYRRRSWDFPLFEMEEKARAVVNKALPRDSSHYRSLRYCVRGLRGLAH